MAMERNNSHLNIAAPPPSPIPTGRGSRSAANDTFSEFLQKSVHLPHLELPGSHFHVSTRHPVPEAVDLRSLAARGGDSVDRILRSAREYGAFRISGHGISGEELRSLVEEADWEENFVVSNGNREEIVWGRSQQQCFESARKLSGTDRFRNFSQNMENVASKLEAIAKQVSQVFIENAGKQFTSGKQEKETLLTLYRYNHHNPLLEQNPPLTNEKIGKLCDHVFSLHLPIELCQVRVQSGRLSLSFEAGPDIIVVTVGKQLEEWSLGKFKCVSGEMIFVPDLHGSQTSFSVELKFSSSSIIPSQNMENVASKLEAIAKQVSQVFIENAGKQFTSGKQEKETLLTLYRYNHHNPLMEQNPPLTNEKIGKLCDHVFSLHLPIELCQVRVQSGRFPLSFEAGPDIIVVTVGKQLEEWSLGKFKCVSGEMIFVPDLHGSQTSFSVELKFSSSSIIPRVDKKYKTISVTDQILVPFIVAFLYKIFVYILSET